MAEAARLQSLRIRNLAIIEDLTWEPGPGLNILTGETGAGKSILIDGLGLILGEKADRTMIRQGAEGCLVEAFFSSTPELNNWGEENGFLLEKGEPLSVRRVVSADGQNRQFINGSQTTLQVLRDLGTMLVDLHGPHDHQALLGAEAQRKSLDRAACSTDLAREHAELYGELRQLREELHALRQGDEAEWKRRADYLSFQVGEIEKADLKPDEEEALEQEYKTGSNARRIFELAEGVKAATGEDGLNLLGGLAQVEKLLREWEKLDARAAALLEFQRHAWVNIQELEAATSDLAEATQVDSERLTEVETRLTMIQSLKRKHGSTVADVLARLKELQAEWEELKSRDGRLASLEKKISDVEIQRAKVAAKLSEIRRKTAPGLSRKITAELQELGFPKAEFSIQLTKLNEPSTAGEDGVEMMFSGNVGESARPLKAVASSGEMARVMLAVKTVLAQDDDVPILVFDEIDANVGGLTAVTVGKKLRGLSEGRQVICITHLPQVASAGVSHFSAQKREKAGRTLATVVSLKEDDLVEEIARMLGGKGESARKMALDLLAEQQRSPSKKTKK